MVDYVRIRLLATAAMLLLAACDSGDGGPQASAATAAASAQGNPAYVAMARGEVDVEGGLVRISAPRDGVVATISAADGDAVKTGQILAELDPRQAHAKMDAANAALNQAKAQAAVLSARRAATEVHARRVAEAASAGAATGQSADEARTAASVLKAEISAADAATAVARQQVDQARAELAALGIRAPVAGRIVRRAVQVGEFVSPQSGKPLFELLPDRPYIVRAELNEAFVDKVKPGMLADVVRDAAPNEIHSARVIRVGAVFGPSRLADDPLDRATARDVECVLLLDGADLRVGQRVLVKFRRNP